MTDAVPEYEGLISGLKIKRAISKRKKKFELESVHPKLIDEYLSNGWEVDVKFKTKTRVKREKSIDIQFEDYVWTVLAKLGFNYLNSDRNFRLSYGLDVGNSKQIDVFAVDPEAILVIECKVSTTPKRSSFKKDIESFGGMKSGIIKSIKKMFPRSKHKIKFIFATKNYSLSEPDKERLQNFDILHFDEDIIEYYNDLTTHLGHSARFQLLGNLFQGQKIPELDNLIPAIQGKMGGHTYYSFSIEPHKLLKIGYVLHRNKANKKLMPTYQRLIKRSRLKSVKEFVDGGGYFPNSIIINLESKRKLKFDIAKSSATTSISRIGTLHLPKSYRSAFIIDGQHRLYGYTDSLYRDSNTIPVVAFEGLNRKDQVKIFMQINEKQKAVPKNLRNTLNANLLWDSESYIEQIKALKLQIAQDLGEDRDSPLYERVIIGENKKNKYRCITIDTIKTGLDRTNFFGSFTKTSIKEDGSLYKGNNDTTYTTVLPFIKMTLYHIKDALNDQWEQGEEGDGILTINASINSLLRLLGDIVDHLKIEKELNTKSIKTSDLVEETIYFLDPLIRFFKNLSPEEREDLRKSYGTAGRTKFWRTLQLAVRKERPEFNPLGLDEYISREAKTYNEKSFTIIRDLEIFFKKDFRYKLKKAHGKSWFKKGIPQKVYEKSIALAAAKNREIEDEEKEKEPWDCLNIIDYRAIAVYGKNWSEIFEESYTKQGEEKMSGGKDAKTKWMVNLERIRNENFHSYSVTEEEFLFLEELKAWLLEGTE